MVMLSSCLQVLDHVGGVLVFYELLTGIHNNTPFNDKHDEAMSMISIAEMCTCLLSYFLDCLSCVCMPSSQRFYLLQMLR